MDIKSFQISKILITFGIIGTFLVIICFIFLTFIPCNSFKMDITKNLNNLTYIDIDNKKIEIYKQACILMDYNKDKGNLNFYYDNFFLLIDDFKSYLEILKMVVYLGMNSFIYFCQIIILKYLDSITILVNNNFYYFVLRLIIFIKYKAEESYMKHSFFFLMEIEELISIFAYFIYMEIIELKFCKLDYDLKKNITSRSISEIDILDEERSVIEDDLEVKDEIGIL